MFYKMRLMNIVIVSMIMMCAPFSTDREQPVDFPHPGMIKILSAGKLFQQGWNDSLASLDEKPGMVSAFTYDYWLDTTEVTQKFYFDLMERNPVSDSSLYGIGERYPVSFVTWYDAVLFCNARSKADGLDTVYRYLSKYSYPDGSVSQIYGIQCDFSKDGYRLPTEAEWEFAARGESSSLPFCTQSDLPYAQSVAWFGANSSGTPQPVATKIPNSIGFYDLAGNVSEWTNDWKGPYNGKAVTNSLGEFQPNSQNEKVIKGGAFNCGLTYLRPSYRSAVFSTTVSTKNEYLGFRCARGPIPNGHYFGPVTAGPINFALDSLGVYFDSTVNDITQEIFADKMHFFWKSHNDIDVVFIGSVGVFSDVDCSAFTRYKALNMGFYGCGIYTTSMIMSNYLFNSAPKLKLIGIDIPFSTFSFQTGDGSSDYFSSQIASTKGYQYDSAHNFWKDSIPAGFDEAVVKTPVLPLWANLIDSLGFVSWPCRGWGGPNPDTIGGSEVVGWTIDSTIYQQNLSTLIKMIQDATAHNIHLLAINLPMSPYYQYTGYYSMLGPSWETGRAVLAQLKALEAIYPYFHVYDAYQDGNHDYTDEDAASCNQLCTNGAKKLTVRLDMLINSILAKQQ